MSGTDLAYDPISLRKSYAISVTHIAYGPTRLRNPKRCPEPPIVLRIRYAMYGTELCHEASAVRYWHQARCYRCAVLYPVLA
eukprot:1283488-Rhodomonas_salina.5